MNGSMVREGRLELPICRQSWILSPVRLPVPPLSRVIFLTHRDLQLDILFEFIRLFDDRQSAENNING
jgi:hypothetical protein